MNDDRLLLAFALGSFHAALLTMLLVLPLYLLTDIGEALENLNTMLGLAAFGALWATSIYCTHRGVEQAGIARDQTASKRRLLAASEVWGAWNGMLFFWCLLAAGLVLLAVSALGGEGSAVSGSGFATSDGETVEVTVQEEGGVLEAMTAVAVVGIVAGGVGTVVAAFIGVITGVIFSVLDMTLLHLARSVAGQSHERVQ